MKKTKSVIVVLLVFSTVLVTQNHIVESESADHIKFYAFTVYSPLNRTYNSEFLVLNLTFNVGMGIRYTLKYNIDKKYEASIPFKVENPNELHVVNKATGYAALPELSEGSHNLTIHLIASGYLHGTLSFAETIYFTTNTQNQDNLIPESFSWLILPLFLISTLSVIIVRKRFTLKSKHFSNHLSRCIFFD